MADSELMQLYKSDRNPSQETRYQELLRQQNIDPSQVGRGGNGSDAGILSPTGALAQTSAALGAAKQIRDFNIQSNQPAIQSLQKQSTDLDSRYKDLLASIKGQQSVASDKQTLATNNELARRGIGSDSGLYEQQQAMAQAPIAANYQSLSANAGIAQQDQVNALAQAIAQYQTGDPNAAMSAGLNINAAAQAAQQFQQNYEQQQQQFSAQQQQQQFANNLASQQSAYQQQRNPLELALLQAQVNNANKPTGGGSGIDLSAIIQALGGGGATTPSSFKPSNVVSAPNVSKDYRS